MSDEIDYTRIERPNPPEPTKDCLKCEEVIRTGRCRCGRKTPYLKGGKA